MRWPIPPRNELHVHHHFDDEALSCLMRLFTKEFKEMSAQSDAILAKVTANTDKLQSVSIAVDGLNDQSTSIAEEIARLKALIEAGQPVDLTALEAKVDEQAALIGGLETAIGANTTP